MPYVSEYEQLASLLTQIIALHVTQNGDFILLDNGHIPYSGCLSMDEGIIQCRVDRMNNPPGYVNGVFMSLNWLQHCFIVFSNCSNFQDKDAQNIREKRPAVIETNTATVK
uniref:Uncharacterized protein n=1 Tax=Ditylenchus dipsaci TaxID=166011 RepID=A0A915DT37_9BILA